jgi:D-alanyl-D-alanine carboxypeptidase/D-alanyl-D-alanine-endopeptidase (penicillin-binding protein 4)
LGVDGTLALIQTSSPARGHVFAKTGTDGFTDNLNDEGNVVDKGLAGFITGVHGHHVAFAFYINEMKGPHGEDTPHEAGQILGALAAATYLTL